MGIDYSFLEDGTTLQANTLTSRFSSIASGINTLDDDDVAPAAFNLNHLPSSLVYRDTVTITGTHTYTADSTPSGSTYPGYGSNSGWTQITQGGTDLKLTPGNTLKLSDDSSAYGARGILLMADINFRKIEDGGAVASQNFVQYFCIQYQSGGSWYTIANTERYVYASFLLGVSLGVFYPVTIRFLCTTETIAHTEVTGFRVMTALGWDNPDAPAGTLTATLAECSFSAMAFRSKLFT